MHNQLPFSCAPDGFDSLSGVLNWHLVYILGLATKLEEWAGETLLAQQVLPSCISQSIWESSGVYLRDGFANYILNVRRY